MSQIRLRIVGESVIELGSKRITPTSPQMFALLLFLGTEHDREVPRAQLIDLLYPASEAGGDSSHRLRQLLYKLRGLGAPFVFGEGTVRLDGKHVRNEVTELLAGGREARRERASKSFVILPHYVPLADTPLSDWVEMLREQLHHSLCQHLSRDLELTRAKADWRSLEAIARRTLELDPLNESAVLSLAEATARTGSKARAVSMLDSYRTELGESRSHLALPALLLQKRIAASRDRELPARHPLVPFVGRERELESLLSQWESARRSNAQLLWLTGNKSVGKSRLLDELATSALLNGSGHVVRLSMSPMDADRPLSLIATLANRLSSLPGAAGCDPLSLEALGRLSGTIAIPSSVNPDNSSTIHNNAAIRNAISDLVACVCDERPVLVLVDDAQHIDEASEHLADAVLGKIANKRLLIVASCSSDRVFKHRHAALHLEPLSANSSAELWEAMSRSQDLRLPESISRMCLDAAAGNPGHMELLAQQAVMDPEHFSIPVDLIALVDRRLGQLSEQARYTLQAVVILDDAATPQSVAHLTGLSPYDLLAAFHLLESSDLLLSTQSGLRCRSTLIAERVRATSHSAVISTMEGRAASYFEQEQPTGRWSPSTAWRIASHWQRAGEPRRARSFLRAGWQHAVSVGQPTRASAAISDVLRTATDPEDRASLLDDFIGTLQAAGDLGAVISAVAERRTLSSRVHDTPSRVAQLTFDEDEASLLRNSNPAAHITAIRAHLESSLLNPHRRIRAARLLMIAADANLDPSLASFAIDRCQKLTPDSKQSQLLLSQISLIYHTIFGNADEALQIADDIQQQTKSLERSWYTTMSDRNCAFARQLAAPGPSDYESFERAFSQSLDAAMPATALGHAGSLISVLIDDGDLSRAQELITTAEQLAEAVDSKDFAIDYLGAQVDLSLLTGNLKKAARYLDLMERSEARYQSMRNRNDLLIYRLRVQQFLGEFSSAQDYLEPLLGFHEVGKRLTRHDDHMEVLWQTLTTLGENERASRLLADYLLRHRRERRPCRYMLRIRTQCDPAWDLFTGSSQDLANQRAIEAT